MTNRDNNPLRPRGTSRVIRHSVWSLFQSCVCALVYALALVGVVVQAAWAQDALLEVKATIEFNGIEYYHRKSGLVEHEFTPNGQTDLANWTDMLTIGTYKGATDEDKLAVRARALLSTYQKSGGKVLRAASSPATESKPAEHFIAAVFASPEFIEFVHLRLRLTQTFDPPEGLALFHSHRIYGKGVGEQIAEWVKENGLPYEQALMTQEIALSAESALTKLKK